MNSLFRFSNILAAALLALGLAVPALQAAPAKIFILAGQSNMVGQGVVAGETTPGTLAYTVANDLNGDYQFLVDGAGAWVQRSDVWYHSVSQADGNAGLTAGFGIDGGSIGPELGFGHAMGDLYEEPVILIKVAQGGRSLGVDFLPPSSGPYATPVADGDIGYWYERIIADVNGFIANDLASVPGYDAVEGYEIAGLCWHQGYNDLINVDRSAAYEANLVNFINDIRSDLSVPNLPFVIATTGTTAWFTYREVELAQLAVADAAAYPAFAGNVATIDTRQPYEDLTFWQLVEESPNNEDYHWNRNAKSYVNLGLAMADVMSQMVPARCPYRLRATGDATGVTLSWEDGTDAATSVRVLRDSSEIAAAAPISPASYLDTTAEPGLIEYQLEFAKSGDPCPPLTLTFDAGITDLDVYRFQNKVRLKWTNNLGYANIEVRRNGSLIDTIAGTATSYDDTSPPASGDVTYSVVPTNGSAAPTEETINLDGLSPGNAYIYEPFADADSTLRENRVGAGLSGRWIGNSSVVADSLSFGTLPTSGNHVSNPGGSDAVVNTRIRSELAEAGLLDHGGELWFSFLTNNTEDVNTTVMFCLGTDRSTINKSPASEGSVRGVQDGGQAIGVFLDRGTRPQAATWQAEARSTGTTTGTIPSETTGLVVGRITWGADGASADTVEIFLPGTDLVLPGSPVSTTSAVMDQAQFDVLSFSGKNVDSPQIDEIRFAASYDDVIATDQMVPDTTPPSPDPMIWATPPAALGDSSITMTATTATDLNGVEYYFESVSGGGNDSGWQDSSIYVDTGLNSETEYTYRVRARDKSPNQNATDWSPNAAATTEATDNGSPPIPGFDVAPFATSSTEISMTAETVVDPEGSGVEYYFTETSGNAGGDDSGWQDSTTYTDSGLSPSTTYSYTVKARDKSAQQNSSLESAAFDATTQAPPSGPGGALIYEGFDYDAGGLGTNNGGTGFTAAWSTIDSSPSVVAPGLSYGSLAVAGNGAGKAVNSGSGAGARLIGDTSALDSAGLMANGQSLWFSFLLSIPSGHTNVDFNFSLGSDGFADYGSGEFGDRTSLQSGEGIGVAKINRSSSVSDIVGAYYQDNDADSYAERVTQLAFDRWNGATLLIVGRIDWGADDLAGETLTLYTPDTDLNLGTAVLDGMVIPALDQSAFDTVAFQMKDAVTIDEIRFGATYEDVIGLGGSASDYDTWSGGPFLGTLGDSNPELDFDGGGLDTGIEYVVGGDPTDGSDDMGKAPGFDNTTDPDKFLFVFRRSDLANADPNTTIAVEYGSNLSGWTTAAHEGTDPTQISISEVDDFYEAGIDQVTVAIPRSLAVGEKLFARLKVAVSIP
ncbi:sialate O-acetylesterase [Haloferula sp. A504]|uniref:sialate O-acetylesterase n=1 Tax=Haloferula sp. A504 TaxID=3373601 RepID=UPI0031CAA777|nr:sialate O-acetylesterase [Verrucomicrobiaceae bacterium E54]